MEEESALKVSAALKQHLNATLAALKDAALSWTQEFQKPDEEKPSFSLGKLEHSLQAISHEYQPLHLYFQPLENLVNCCKAIECIESMLRHDPSQTVMGIFVNRFLELSQIAKNQHIASVGMAMNAAGTDNSLGHLFSTHGDELRTIATKMADISPHTIALELKRRIQATSIRPGSVDCPP